jgi:hypothetical protein
MEEEPLIAVPFSLFHMELDLLLPNTDLRYVIDYGK